MAQETNLTRTTMPTSVTPTIEYKGHTPGYSGTGTKADKDNHANQGNPNNSRYQAPKK